jgi:hypothetical protein
MAFIGAKPSAANAKSWPGAEGRVPDKQGAEADFRCRQTLDSYRVLVDIVHDAGLELI